MKESSVIVSLYYKLNIKIRNLWYGNDVIFISPINLARQRDLSISDGLAILRKSGRHPFGTDLCHFQSICPIS